MDDEEQRMNFLKDSINIAYKSAPFGNFFEIWIPGVCNHDVVRCVHGDEIAHIRGRRRRCLICGRSLKGDIPLICFFTGMPH